MLQSELREKDIRIALFDRGVRIDMDYLEFNKGEFKAFIAALLSAMGFRMSSTVRFERDGDGRLDWQRLRISAKECAFHEVTPSRAVEQARRWLSDSRVWDRYGVCFRVA